MTKKTFAFLIISFLMCTYAMAQNPVITIYQAGLTLHPDAKNKNGCVFTLPNLNQSFGVNNQIKWEFNVQELTPTIDAEEYFAEAIDKEWKITFVDPQANERLLAEKLSSTENMIQAECIFNGIIVNLELKITKKLNKQKVMYNEIIFKVAPNQIGLNGSSDLEFVLTLEKQ